MDVQMGKLGTRLASGHVSVDRHNEYQQELEVE